MRGGMELERWIKQQCEAAGAVLIESLKQLMLTEGDEQDVRLQVENTVEQDLPRFVRSLALIASLGTLQNKDKVYFQRRGVTEDQANDLAQKTAERILKCLFSGWPHGNIGAWRSQLRQNVLNDFGREQHAESQYLDRQRDPDEFPEKCNPLTERELIEDISKRWSDLEREIIDRRLWGEGWQEIATSVGKSPHEVNEIAREALLACKSCPRKQNPRKTRPSRHSRGGKS